MEHATSRTLMHPTAVISDGVEIGEGAAIGPYVTIFGPCKLGAGVWIGAGTSIGAPPEISTLRHNTAWTGDLEHAGVEIGDGVILRERVIIHQGSVRPTRVGDRSILLNGAYLAHDVQVAEDVTISAGVSVGGHCTIGRRATLGMNVSVHQRRVIGAGAMVGMAAVVTRDVPPWTKAFGSPVRVHGVNTVGMSRAGIPADAVESLEALYAAGAPVEQAGGIDALAGDVSSWLAAEPGKALTTGDVKQGHA